MKKQIIVVSETAPVMPNVITVSVDKFLSSQFKNAYVLIDRTYVTTQQIIAIKKHCQDSGLNPHIDGGFMDISYVYVQDFSIENPLDAINVAIQEAVTYLEECEAQRKLNVLEEVKSLPKTAVKLLTLAKDGAASFGEKRNAITAAYNMVFCR